MIGQQREPKSDSASRVDVVHHLENALQAFGSNRLVSVSQETGYQALDRLEAPAEGWSRGLEVRVQQVPVGLKLFKLVATEGSSEGGITNHLAAHLNREMVIEAVQVRWHSTTST
ncbi:hypothetical protein A0257_11050 [Hymenobacter psoromatis]|nr:hypothetical protein A0257_11050 [Hymenobacter psoromatis]